jgi:hypothetical protein
MIEVKNETRPVVTKVVIELNGYDLSNFNYMLSDYKALRKNNCRGEWPWLDKLRESLEKARNG